MLRVMVVDDQALVRRGFALILDNEPDIEVVAEAGTGIEAVEAARAHQPDIILMDIRMPEMDGLEATARILEASDATCRVIILTTFDPDEYVFRALRAGASGFVLKDIPPEALVQAVRTVAEGGAMLAPGITQRLISQFAQKLGAGRNLSERLERLTTREREVLEAIAAGKSNAEIAEALFIGPATVKTHVSSLLSKLGLRDRAQAVVFAYECGLATVGSAMSDSRSTRVSQRNALYRLAAISAVILGLFLTLGAQGHLVAIWPMVTSEGTDLSHGLLLMLPSMMLAGAAVLNLLLCKPLWQERGYALNVTLASNLLTMSYLFYLMIRGVPNHPIGVFLALEMSFVLLLVVTRAGLVWPAVTEAPVEKGMQ